MIRGTKKEQLEILRKDILDFKATKNLDKVIVLWTANTERFSSVIEGVNDTAENLLKAIDSDHPEISPSTLFAVAAAKEGVSGFIGREFVVDRVLSCLEEELFIHVMYLQETKITFFGVSDHLR